MRRRSATRGWRKAAPKLRSQRHRLKKSCGARCFLDSKNLKFPICRKCSASRCACKPDCKGLAAAYGRARQYGYKKFAKKALSIAKRQGCRWAGRR